MTLDRFWSGTNGNSVQLRPSASADPVDAMGYLFGGSSVTIEPGSSNIYVAEQAGATYDLLSYDTATQTNTAIPNAAPRFYLDWGQNSGSLSFTGASGADTIYGGLGNDTLTAGNLNNAGEGGDWLDGGLGNDILGGFDGADRLYGGFGKDTLDGGLGNDTLEGGDGKDIFTGTAVDFANDTITDFALGDKIIIKGGDFSELNGSMISTHSSILLHDVNNSNLNLLGSFGDGTYDAKYDSDTESTTIRIFYEAPTLVASPNGVTNFSVGSDMVIQFNEFVHHGSGGVIEIIRASDDAVVETITTADLDPQNTSDPLVSFLGDTIIINPAHDLEAGKAYYLKITEDFIDNDGQTSYIAGKTGPNSYNLSFSTAAVAPPPSTDSGGSGGGGSGSTVDGVTVTTGTTDNGDGTSSTTLTIPVVTNTRAEQVGNNAVADIPLVSSGGASLLTAQLPIGYGLSASGSATPKAAGNSLADLIREIKAHTSAGSSDQSQLTGGGSGFLGGLSASTPLLVQTLVPSVAPGSTATPTTPLVIAGTPAAAGGPQTALVIDTRGLPSGSAIQLQNVNFAAVIGAVTVTGGDGSQTVWGDSANQTIILGADDDTLHGGGGDDFVGSKTGNDVLYGDDGTDTVQGGEENDQLYGNTGSDVLFGNTGTDTLFGGKGEDLLHGGQDDDRLSGDLGADSLHGDAGNDVLIGGLSDGSMADASGDLLFGNAGADLLFGNAGADTLYGGQEADTLYGGLDGDQLFGDLGNDVLAGDRGADTLTGGAGADLFVFSTGSGLDMITDFSAAEGDRLQLAEGQGYSLRSDAAGNAVIVFSGDDEVVLRGIRREDVQTGWFVTG